MKTIEVAITLSDEEMDAIEINYLCAVCHKDTAVTPDYYTDSGTPSCCDEDMRPTGATVTIAMENL